MENLQSQQEFESRQKEVLGNDLKLFLLYNTARQYRILRQLVIEENPSGTEGGWITATVVRGLLRRIAVNEPVVREVQNFLGQPEDPTLSEITGASLLSSSLAGPINRLLVARVSDVLDKEEDFACQLLAFLQLDLAILPSQLVEDFGHLRLADLREQLDSIPMDLRLLERAPVYEKNLNNLEELERSCRDQLISNYEPLVDSIARQRWAGLNSIPVPERESPITLDDLVQQGQIALINSIEGFKIRRVILDSSRAVKNGGSVVSFASYARPAIEHEISDFIRRNLHAVAIPKEIARERRRMAQVEAQLRSELRKYDVEWELYDALGLPREKYDSLRNPFLPAKGLRDPVGSPDSDLTLADTISDPSVGPEELVCSKLMVEKMLQALQTLPERDRRVLELRFGLGRDRELTFDELGRELGISRQAVHKTVGRALKKLRDPALGLVEG